MKKKLKIAIIALLTIACFLFGSCISLGLPPRNNEVEPKDISKVSDGTYVGVGRVTPSFGTAAVFRKVTANVTVTGGRITAVTVVKPLAIAEPLAEMAERMISENSADVDVISGATWSSKALAKAVDAALMNQKIAK
jgi:uncharacterized protein with FMN-binding domain